MYKKHYVCFLFLDQDEVGPSISSWVILCSFILLVYTVVLVLVFYLCLLYMFKTYNYNIFLATGCALHQ